MNRYEQISCINCLHKLVSPRSDSADAQSDQGLHCPLQESLDTTEYINGEQRPGRDFAHAQDDENQYRRHIFRLGAAQLILKMKLIK